MGLPPKHCGSSIRPAARCATRSSACANQGWPRARRLTDGSPAAVAGRPSGRQTACRSSQPRRPRRQARTGWGPGVFGDRLDQTAHALMLADRDAEADVHLPTGRDQLRSAEAAVGAHRELTRRSRLTRPIVSTRKCAAPARCWRVLRAGAHEDVAGAGGHCEEGVIALHAGVPVVRGALFGQPVCFADRRVKIDREGVGARSGTRRPGAGEELPAHPVELAHLAPAEAAQERAERRGRLDLRTRGRGPCHPPAGRRCPRWSHTRPGPRARGSAACRLESTAECIADRASRRAPLTVRRPAGRERHEADRHPRARPSGTPTARRWSRVAMGCSSPSGQGEGPRPCWFLPGADDGRTPPGRGSLRRTSPNPPERLVGGARAPDAPLPVLASWTDMRAEWHAPVRQEVLLY